jgi:Kef-type K+ transport system membrane component KefB
MLATAWLAGEALHKLGQPALVGQLLAGVLIGPSVFNLVQTTTDLSTVENVSLFFIMLLTGLAVNPSKLAAAGKRGAVVSSISFVLPFIAGVVIAESFGIGVVGSLTAGLTVSITAVPVNSIILMELGLLDTDLGLTVIAAGVIDDITAFVALSLIEQYAANGRLTVDGSLEFDIGKIVLFLGAVLASEHLIRYKVGSVRRLTGAFESRLKTNGSFFALIIVSAIGISLLAEWSGLQFAIGAFFAGLLLGELAGPVKLAEASSVVRGATYGFFGPLAFSFIGLEFALGSVKAMPLFVLTLLLAALASKFFGGWVGARLSGFCSSESSMIGHLMNSRGFVELVIATTAYQLGLIDQSLFSILVGVGIITTILSPMATRRTMKSKATASPSGSRVLQAKLRCGGVRVELKVRIRTTLFSMRP